MKISSNFDGGNIEVISKKSVDDIRLRIRPDKHADFLQWFYFRLQGIAGYPCKLKIINAGNAYSKGRISPDFQTNYGYPPDKPGMANLSICSKNIAHRFDCLSLTIEMPFKDNENLPDPKHGWSPERSIKLGESLINVLLDIVDDLR